MRNFVRTLASLVAMLSLVCAFALSAQAKLPEDMADYQNRYAKEAKTPEGALKLWHEGLMLYQESISRDLGRKILVAITDQLPADFEKNSMHATFVNRVTTEPQIIRSYCAGSTPENNYKADPNKCELTITRSTEEYDGTWAIWIKSSGADSTRKVVLTKDGEHWKISSYPGIYMGIRPAVTK